jgi:uncharacterized protein YdhG (YjbR/CyaY superfamily)/uncharacterized protein YndB with AHSA1/START domain
MRPTAKQEPDGAEIEEPATETVAAYIAAAPSPARERLEQIRAEVRQTAPGAEESISYRIPTFKQKGPLVYYAAFASHVGIYPVTAAVRRWMPDVVERHGAGKGTLRFPLEEPLPLDVVSRFTRVRLAENLGLDDSDPDLEIVSSRRVPFARDRVFAAFSNPDVLAQWWGPRGFANRFVDFEMFTGGSWNFVMEGPDGSRYEMRKRFVEVVPAQRIVLEHLDSTHHFVMTMTFGRESGGTRLTWRARFDDGEEAARVRALFATGNEENYDRLEELLKRA